MVSYEFLNNINNANLTKFDPSYVVGFSDYLDPHADDLRKSKEWTNYYLNPQNVSICIQPSFKYTLFTYFFLNEISRIFNKSNAGYNPQTYFPLSTDYTHISNVTKVPHQLFISSKLINSKNDFIEAAENCNFDRNQPVLFELKLNIDQYLLLTGEITFYSLQLENSKNFIK